MFDSGKVKIPVHNIRKNKPDGSFGNVWTKGGYIGGYILIDDETVTLKYLGTLGIFNRKTVKYSRDKQEELLIRRILRIYDDEQDFSVSMNPRDFEKFIKVMKGK